MANRDIVVVGASSGGVEALSGLVAKLPAGWAASMFIAWHSAPYSHSVLPDVLARAGPIPVAHARHGEAVRQGRIYVAPPDHHMLLEEHRVRLTRGPKENRFRPAVDPLFRSAAYCYGPRVVGVVLSGAMDDGTAGLWAIKDRGGKAIVQDPDEARHPSMPVSALQHVDVDYKLAVADMAFVLVELSEEPADDPARYPVSEKLEIETRIARDGTAFETGALGLGEFSGFTCPECQGALMQIKDGSLVRFRCHTGHAYAPESLLAALGEHNEDALWNAVRCVQESAMLLAHLGRHARETGKADLAASLETEAHAVQKRADQVRRIVQEHGSSDRDLEADVEQAGSRVHGKKRASR